MTDVKILLESFFGEEAKIGSKNYFFHCPICNHYKRKLLIEKTTFQWHCWICENTHHTKGRTLYSLFKFFKASLYYLNEASKVSNIHHTGIPTDSKNLFGEQEYVEDDSLYSNISLPKEFVPIAEEKRVSDPEYKNAVYYLEKRNIRPLDIVRYNIGYCQDGEYSGRIVIPSYDKFFRLNYFVSRAYFKSISLKYKNPNIDKTKIICFESFLNWSLPITIVEGTFDAIPLRYNVTPILGSTLSDGHKLLSDILLKRPPQVNVILDKDAIEKAVNISEILLNNDINTKLILLEDDRDPNELGFHYLSNKIKETQLLDFGTLMKVKLKV